MSLARPRPLALSVVVAAAVLTGACGDTTEQASPPPPTVQFTAGDVPVVVPGAPGGPTETIEPGESGEMANAGAWGETEVDFVTGMVPHHSQALRMSELAPERASDERVLAMAERIRAGQGPEIEAMQQWLVANGLPEAELEGHGGMAGMAGSDEGGMAGMATEEQLLALTSAEGAEFDRMFLERMIVHHEGALAMAEQAAGAINPQVQEMVGDVAVGQAVEIARMQEILDDLP